MKRGIYIIYEELDDKGTNRKIKSQIKAFESHGINILTCYMKTKKIKYFRFYARLPFTNIMPEWRIPQNIEKYDFIYMRRPGFMNISFIKWISAIKKTAPNIKIFMEIPTFPYDIEYLEDVKDLPYYFKDKAARLLLKKHLDYICTLNGEKKIFNVNAIKIVNGYDFSTMRMRKFEGNKREIHIALVARFCFWHGYERLINSLYKYYKSGGDRKVILHFAGDGNEIQRYKKDIEALSLQNNAKFYGFLKSHEITDIYDVCGLAADVFGGYKKNLNYSCSLKSREYLAVGLPIITGIHLDFQENQKLNQYVLEFPNDNSEIEFNKIIKFYDSIYDNNSRQKVACDIRREAELQLNYINSMNNVIKVINIK